MRGSRFSRVSACTLFTVSAVLIIALYFSLEKISTSNQQLQRYQALKFQFNSQLVAKVNSYLNTGNAIALSDAESLLKRLTFSCGSKEMKRHLRLLPFSFQLNQSE